MLRSVLPSSLLDSHMMSSFTGLSCPKSPVQMTETPPINFCFSPIISCILKLMVVSLSVPHMLTSSRKMTFKSSYKNLEQIHFYIRIIYSFVYITSSWNSCCDWIQHKTSIFVAEFQGHFQWLNHLQCKQQHLLEQQLLRRACQAAVQNNVVIC